MRDPNTYSHLWDTKVESVMELAAWSHFHWQSKLIYQVSTSCDLTVKVRSYCRHNLLHYKMK